MMEILNKVKILTLELLGFILDAKYLIVVRPDSYQERALPAELCGPPALYNGGGRIRTYAALTGGRFTVCSD